MKIELNYEFLLIFVYMYLVTTIFRSWTLIKFGGTSHFSLKMEPNHISVQYMYPVGFAESCWISASLVRLLSDPQLWHENGAKLFVLCLHPSLHLAL